MQMLVQEENEKSVLGLRAIPIEPHRFVKNEWA